jgi:hypothetical protein
MKNYTLQDFLDIKDNPIQLKELTIDFLNKEGNNKKLAGIISDRGDVEVKMDKVKLSTLKREMGPVEENLIFSEDREKWNRRVESFAKDIKGGYEPLPLILTNFWTELDLSDGSHRYAALERLGVEEYWAVSFRD